MKKLFSIVLSLLMLLSLVSTMPFSAFAVSSGDWEYELIENNTVQITGYNGTQTDITIPETVDNYAVTQIGEGAFAEKGFKSVVIPGYVKYIGYRAFEWNESLTSLTIENGVEVINSGAFSRCHQIKTLNIPSSVKNIGSGAFYGCASLQAITVEENNTVYDSRNKCNAIIKTESNEIITACKNTIIPEDIEKIGERVTFGEGSITSIAIPKSVKYISEYVFGEESSLVEVYYGGTTAEWGKIDFENGNDYLTSAVIHCTDGTINDKTNPSGEGQQNPPANTNLQNNASSNTQSQNETITASPIGDGVPDVPQVGADIIRPTIKAKAEKKSLTASWAKVDGATGYEVQYSTNKKFKKAKTKKVKASKSSATIKKLKSKKTYYIRIRAVGAGGASKWSKVKKIKVK